METFINELESRLASIPLPERRLFVLTTEKLLNNEKDCRFLERYAARLLELNESAESGRDSFGRILDVCIEAYGDASRVEYASHSATTACPPVR